jgi:hypothetical protein
VPEQLVRPGPVSVSLPQSLLLSALKLLSSALTTLQLAKVEGAVEDRARFCQSLLAARSSLSLAEPHSA